MQWVNSNHWEIPYSKFQIGGKWGKSFLKSFREMQKLFNFRYDINSTENLRSTGVKIPGFGCTLGIAGNFLKCQLKFWSNGKRPRFDINGFAQRLTSAKAKRFSESSSIRHYLSPTLDFVVRPISIKSTKIRAPGYLVIGFGTLRTGVHIFLKTRKHFFLFRCFFFASCASMFAGKVKNNEREHKFNNQNFISRINALCNLKK